MAPRNHRDSMQADIAFSNPNCTLKFRLDLFLECLRITVSVSGNSVWPGIPRIHDGVCYPQISRDLKGKDLTSVSLLGGGGAFTGSDPRTPTWIPCGQPKKSLLTKLNESSDYHFPVLGQPRSAKSRHMKKKSKFVHSYLKYK